MEVPSPPDPPDKVPQSHRVIVMSSEKLVADTNPYLRWLAESQGDDIHLKWRNWAYLLTRRVDVFHVHWPEYLFSGAGRIRTIAKQILGFGLLARLALTRTPVVRTVHTTEPYESTNRVAQFQIGILEKLTTYRIFLNESPDNQMETGCVILLGRYGASAHYHKSKVAHGTIESPTVDLLTFGLLRPYKGIESVITSFSGINRSELRLNIVGKPANQRYASWLRELANSDPRIKLKFGFIDEHCLSRTISESDLVILPYRRMYNSSALLLALEHNVPVLATRSGSTSAMAREIGQSWLHLFDGTLNPASLRLALSHVDRTQRERQVRPPLLSRRDWSTVGALHSRLFRFAREVSSTVPRSKWPQLIRERVESDHRFGEHSSMNLPITTDALGLHQSASPEHGKRLRHIAAHPRQQET